MADNPEKEPDAISRSNALADFFDSPRGQEIAKRLMEEIENPELLPEEEEPEPRLKTLERKLPRREPLDFEKRNPLEELDVPMPVKRLEAAKRGLAPRYSEELKADED